MKHPERYLAIDEEKGNILRYCLDCSLEKGYALYKTEGGKQELTLLVD
jgi:hypothetical protein